MDVFWPVHGEFRPLKAKVRELLGAAPVQKRAVGDHGETVIDPVALRLLLEWQGDAAYQVERHEGLAAVEAKLDIEAPGDLLAQEVLDQEVGGGIAHIPPVAELRFVAVPAVQVAVEVQHHHRGEAAAFCIHPVQHAAHLLPLDVGIRHQHAEVRQLVTQGVRKGAVSGMIEGGAG